MAEKATKNKKAVQNSDEIVGLVVSRYSQARDERKAYENKWDDLYQMYRFKPKSIVKGRANLYIPYAFSNVETVFPRMIAKTPRVNVAPVGPQDLQGSLIMKSLIEYTWEKYNLDEVVRRLAKSTLIYGTGVVKVVWKKEIKALKSLETELDADGRVVDSKQVTKSKVTYDAPCVTNLDLREVYFDPDGVTIESCRWIVHRYMATKEELFANPNYKKADLEQITYGFSNDQIRRGLHTTMRPTLSKHEAEVLEYWEDDRLVVIAGGVMLRDEPNPYEHKKKPFVVIVDHIDDQIIYGIGEVEPVEGLQNEMNTLRNMRMDFNTLTLNPVWQVRAGAVTDLDQIRFTPGHKIVVQGNEAAVRPIDMPHAPQTSYKEEESIKMDLQTITGVSDYSKGNESGSLNDTATGISLIQEAANQRFNAKLQNLEFGLKNIAELIRDLWLQFATEDLVIRVTEKDGYQFIKINPEEIRGEYDIRIESGSTVPSNKLQERNEEMNKYNVLTANPLVAQSPEALLEVTRGLLEKWQDPAMESIIEALGAKVGEINEEKQKAQMMEEAQRQAQGMADETTLNSGSAIDPAMFEDEEDDVPEDFKALAAQMLQKGKGPMMGSEDVVNSAAESIRNM
jgi:hypothetical protein